ncbi:hypothetical protein SAVIM338S_00009 [Streptomyces avidinii]
MWVLPRCVLRSAGALATRSRGSGRRPHPFPVRRKPRRSIRGDALRLDLTCLRTRRPVRRGRLAAEPGDPDPAVPPAGHGRLFSSPDGWWGRCPRLYRDNTGRSGAPEDTTRGSLRTESSAAAASPFWRESPGHPAYATHATHATAAGTAMAPSAGGTIPAASVLRLLRRGIGYGRRPSWSPSELGVCCPQDNTVRKNSSCDSRQLHPRSPHAPAPSSFTRASAPAPHRIPAPESTLIKNPKRHWLHARSISIPSPT